MIVHLVVTISDEVAYKVEKMLFPPRIPFFTVPSKDANERWKMKKYYIEQERDHLPVVGTTLLLLDKYDIASYLRVEKIREDFLPDENGYTNPTLYLTLFETDAPDRLFDLIEKDRIFG